MCADLHDLTVREANTIKIDRVYPETPSLNIKEFVKCEMKRIGLIKRDGAINLPVLKSRLRKSARLTFDEELDNIQGRPDSLDYIYEVAKLYDRVRP